MADRRLPARAQPGPGVLPGLPCGDLAESVQTDRHDVHPEVAVLAIVGQHQRRAGVQDLEHPLEGDVSGVGAGAFGPCGPYLDGDQRPGAADRDQVQPLTAGLAVPVDHRQAAGPGQPRGLREHGGPAWGELVHEAFSYFR